MKKTPYSLYTNMEMIVNNCVYAIDTFIEHTNLLDSVTRGCCALSKQKIPDRHEEFFEPYLIESMEFEFVKLSPNENFATEHRRSKEDILYSQRLKNLKIGPVSNLFEGAAERSINMIRSVKCFVDFVYLVMFSENSLDIRKTLTEENKVIMAGSFLCCLLKRV